MTGLEGILFISLASTSAFIAYAQFRITKNLNCGIQRNAENISVIAEALMQEKDEVVVVWDNTDENSVKH